MSGDESLGETNLTKADGRHDTARRHSGSLAPSLTFRFELVDRALGVYRAARLQIAFV